MTIGKPTNVFDDTDWLLFQPIQSSGEVDFSDTRLSIEFRNTFGDPVIQSASSDDGTLVFVAASGDVGPHFLIDLRVAKRTWRIGAPTAVKGDINRQPDPSDLSRVEKICRVSLTVHPGTGSSGIGPKGYGPVLIDAQPYGGRVVTGALLLGPQGESGAPTYQTVADQAGILAIDMSEGAYAKAALSAPAVLSLTGWPTDFEMGRLTVELDIAAGATLTSYPAGTIWSNGVAPVLSVGPAKDVLMFTSIDGGATVFGHLIGQNYR